MIKRNLEGREGQVVFISEMRNPKTNASSTQIMTRNILFGLRSLFDSLIFVPILDYMSDIIPIEQFYAGLFDEIIPIKTITKFKSNRLLGKVSMIWRVMIKTTLPVALSSKILPNSTIIAHCPSIDSGLICNQIKKEQPTVKYIQYWSDPLALSLITPEQYSIKRCVQKWVEKQLHKAPDRIVFGTKTLFTAQLDLYPEIHEKAFSVEVSYNPEETDAPNINEGRIKIGYFGNYYSNIRDIAPFYEAACECPDADFIICGSGDIELANTESVHVKKRIPQDEVAAEESKIDIAVCLLNKVGVQVPGKIFYQTNTKKRILVILDGPRKKDIVEELMPFNRFCFCENNKMSIKKEIYRLLYEGDAQLEFDSDLLSPKRICQVICGLEEQRSL